jgi:hypothetical protein
MEGCNLPLLQLCGCFGVYRLNRVAQKIYGEGTQVIKNKVRVFIYIYMYMYMYVYVCVYVCMCVCVCVGVMFIFLFLFLFLVVSFGGEDSAVSCISEL